MAWLFLQSSLGCHFALTDYIDTPSICLQSVTLFFESFTIYCRLCIPQAQSCRDEHIIIIRACMLSVVFSRRTQAIVKTSHRRKSDNPELEKSYDRFARHVACSIPKTGTKPIVETP